MCTSKRSIAVKISEHMGIFVLHIFSPGRGFAVVAEEVRKLAEQSSKATTDLESLIDQIQNVITAIVNGMGAGFTQPELALDNVSQSSIILNNILGAVEEIGRQVATPTEAAAIGSFVAFIMVLAYRKFEWKTFKDAICDTAKGTLWFANVYLPIFVPIVVELGFDPLWFLMVVAINLQTSFLTPPFGYAIFFLKSTLSEKDLSFKEASQSAVTFILIQLVGLLLCIMFPQIITWLPNLILR